MVVMTTYVSQSGLSAEQKRRGIDLKVATTIKLIFVMVTRYDNDYGYDNVDYYIYN